MEPGFQGSQPGFRRATASALCAILVGIGLARFAYTPLIPALVGEGWFSAAEAAYLGAANLAGYLAGALVADRLTAGRSAAACLRWAMLLAAASLFACALPLGFAWFSAWRFVSGLCGGILMILAAPTVMPGVPPHLRGVVGGVIFTGVGLGIAASGTVVPAMLRVGSRRPGAGLARWRSYSRSWPGPGGRTFDAPPGALLRPPPPHGATALHCRR